MAKKYKAPVPVLFPSFLPCYGAELGWVASHPQFKHLGTPPDGYFFNERPHKAADSNVMPVSQAVVDLTRRLKAVGVSDEEAADFIKSRRPELQPFVAPHTRLAFLPSYPFTLGQVPWVIEIEDTTTLCFPYLANDRSEAAPVKGTSWHAAIRTLLEHPNCRGIVTHVRSTAESLPKLFDSPELAAKVTHAPIGVKLPPRSVADRPDSLGRPVTLLFSNSWHQDPRSFYVRGGLDVLESFQRVRERESCHLIIRSALPNDLPARYHEIIARLGVEVVDTKLDDSEMEALLDRADVYVLPAARLHVVSVLQAMARGMATVVSDGWGMREYVEDGVTGVVVTGRDGVTSWVDSDSVLREDYTSTRVATPQVVQQLAESIERLVTDHDLRRRLGRAARDAVRTRFTVENWNTALGRAFDLALDRPR